ncbi:glucose PTS transporter subunit IIA [Mycoplasma iguanae]|uniref:Glucose PTS transporter subunit IIA n=1 Tax=Mycoplasma iguanae TaxID=292461 RepID=A0ABY5R7S1_9MOLU|nr:PTS transporter subunit IIABC [Mycoplasma iguanae]UVD81528.1 glucose PTS transporter subunit IIA [Mycoplasma iguanae]
MTLAKKQKFSDDHKSVKARGGNSKLKLFLSKLSGAFMLPISLMAIAGLFLGVGATIASLAGQDPTGSMIHLQRFGKFIENLGSPVFAAMPLVFAAAFVVAYSEEAGVGVFAAIIGYLTFSFIQQGFISHPTKIETVGDETKTVALDGWEILFTGAGRDPIAMKSVVGSSLGITSLQTSIFGGILVGLIVSWTYNKFHTIQLPQIISFFGGKRFVSLMVILFMVPLAFLFLIFWPWVGVGLNNFGILLGKSPAGVESLIFGYIERSLIPFGLHHAFYSPLWYTSVGGNVLESLQRWSEVSGNSLDASTDLLKWLSAESAQGTEVVGDSYISVLLLKSPFNSISYKTAATGDALQSKPLFEFVASELGIKVGRYMQGKYSFMQFALPAAAAAMIMAAPKENRKMAAGTVIPSAVTSFVTGVTEPIEFTFLFLAPYMFWGFHAIMAAISFMLMNILGAHMGMTFSGGILDTVIYGIIPVQKGTNFWWYLAIGAGYVPIYYFVFYYVIKLRNLETPGRGENTKLFTRRDFDAKNNSENQLNPQLSLIVEGMGGWENVINFNNCASRLRYDIKDRSKVSEAKLKAAGAAGVKFVGANHVQAIFGPQAEQFNSKIKSLKGAKLSSSTGSPVETTVQKSSIVSDGKIISVSSVVEKGTLKKLESLNDGVFSENMMGDGVVVEFDKKAKVAQVFAPISGTLEVVFPTGHAYGIKSKEGVSLLVHIGIDTVNLNGKGFTSKVKQGQKVKQGDLLAEVDLEFVRKNAPSTDVIIVVNADSSLSKVIDAKFDSKVSKESELFKVK